MAPTREKVLFAQPQKSGWFRVYETHLLGVAQWASQPLFIGRAGFYLTAPNASHDARHGLVVFGFGRKDGVLKRLGRTRAGGLPLRHANDPQTLFG